MSPARQHVCRLRRLGNSFRLYEAATLAGFLCLVFVTAVPGQAPRRWKTGQAFERVWASDVQNLVWSAGTPVREAVEALERTQGVAILLDRRIDPQTAIELSLRDVPTLAVLQRLATQCGATPVMLNDVVYLGPRMAVGGLSVAAESRRREASRLPKKVSTRFLATREWKWDTLAEPRALIQDLADEAHVKIENVDQIPHDLWPARELPALPWVDRLSLVLAGFGLTYAFEEEGRRVQLVTLPEAEIVDRTYDTALNAMQLEAILAAAPPGVIKVSDGQLEVHGTVEEHSQLQRLLAGRTQAARQGPGRKPADGSGVGKTLFTLKVASQPLEAILHALENQFGLQVQWDDALREQLQTRVTFEVREAKLEQLLDAALKPVGLTFRQTGDTITILRQE